MTRPAEASQQTECHADLSVVVVNYGTADLAIAAVNSVLSRDHGGRVVDVHLVDNASPGKDGERLARAHAEEGWAARVTLYLETVNHGFGGGNNVALLALSRRESPPSKVLLLNPDARLEGEALATLADFMDTHPRAGVVGPRIAKPGQGPVTAVFRFPTLASEFDSALNFGPVSRLLRRWRVALPPETATTRVDWVAGAAAMFRFDAIRDLGFFDTDYFLYYEEVDLMRRLAGKGWEAWHVAEAEVTHIEGAATQVRSSDTTHPRRPDYWYDSRRLYFQKNHGRAYALATALLVAGGGTLHHVIAAARRRPSSLPESFQRDYRRRVLLPLLGLKGAER